MKEIKEIKKDISEIKLLMNVEIQILKQILTEIQGGKRLLQA